MSERSVAIVGATGAVGQEFLRLFEERNFPVGDLKLLASERSVGKKMTFRGKEYAVALAEPAAFNGVDVAFFSAGASRSRELIPHALEAGALVLDNSSAYRMNPAVPLVVPEVNPEQVGEAKLLAVANCTAIILCVAVKPIADLAPIDRLIVSTYQSASGGGAQMMDLLEKETLAVLTGDDMPSSPLQYRYAFNLFSHNTAIADDGYNDEERKVVAESRKILGMPELKINVTCVRVPVLRAHTETVTVEFKGRAPSIEEVRGALEKAPGVRVIDDRENNRFPTPHDASGQGDILVGRLRQDVSNPNAISMLIAGDQLLKGAALNAVQLAELALAR